MAKRIDVTRPSAVTPWARWIDLYLPSHDLISSDRVGVCDLGFESRGTRKSQVGRHVLKSLSSRRCGHQAEGDPNETKSGVAQDKCPRVHAKDSVVSRRFAWT